MGKINKKFLKLGKILKERKEKMKKLICILLGITLSSIAFAYEDYSPEISKLYCDFVKIYISDVEQINLFAENQNKVGGLIYSMNTESGNLQIIDKTEKTIRKKGYFHANLSPGLLPGLSFGYGWIESGSSKYFKEYIPTFHISYLGSVSAIGIFLQMNYFKNITRKGLFWMVIAGIDYGITEPFIADPGGGPSKDKKVNSLFPNLSIGGGYSFKIGKDSFFRISFDVGIKLIISNLTFSVIL